MSGPFAQLEAGWNRFWFAPQETSTLALFRIGFGLVATFWTLSLLPNLFVFFGPDGIMAAYPQEGPGAWGVLAVSSSKPFVVLVFAATLLGSLALTVGLRTRLAAVVVFLGILAFERRNPLVGNSGDELIGNLALFCALAPCGVALSLDRLRAASGRFWEFPARAPWALRLIQIQLSVVYLSAVWQKVQGELWRNGTAVSYALRITDVHRFATPDFLTHSVVLSELLTFGTLALEASLGILVWNRVARPWVLTLGILMHLGIDFSILVGFFSYAMIVSYIAFVPAETASQRIIILRDWFLERRKDRWTDGGRGSTKPVPDRRSRFRENVRDQAGPNPLCAGTAERSHDPNDPAGHPLPLSTEPRSGAHRDRGGAG
jgi:hypothetical protein